MKKNSYKKIIISSYDDLKNPVYAGGGARAVHEVAKRLSKNFEVTVITGTYKKAKNETRDHVKYLRIGMDQFGHKVGQLIFQYELLRYALKLDYDLWIESATPPFTFSLLPLFCKKRVIVWTNMLCSYDMQRKYKFNFRFIERELSRLYRIAVAPSDWALKELRRINKKVKTVVIPHGYEPEATRKSIYAKPEFKNYILYLGRIEVEQKGLDLLAQALSLANDKTRVVIGGQGSDGEENKLSKLIAKYGVEDKVVRLGRVDGARKLNLIRNAAAVVIPSRFETFSLAALEALVMGRPIICFNIAQLSWIPGKYSIKVKPFNADSLSRYISSVAVWKGSKKMTGAAQREFLRVYSWDNIAGQFKNLIRGTIA